MDREGLEPFLIDKSSGHEYETNVFIPPGIRRSISSSSSIIIISMRLKEPALVALRGSVAHESKLQASGNRLFQGRWDKSILNTSAKDYSSSGADEHHGIGKREEEARADA